MPKLICYNQTINVNLVNGEIRNMDNNSIEQLRKYKSLLDEGVINQEEFDAVKTQLLSAPLEESKAENPTPIEPLQTPLQMPYAPSGSYSRPRTRPGFHFNKKVLIGGIAAIVVVVLLAVVLGGGPNFKSLYKKYCSSPWATVGNDGSYLRIDTNPFDEDDNGLAYPEAWDAIKKVNEALGIPESVLSDMQQTSSMDGRQEYVSKKVKVSWKYHPDNGLEVTYSK